MIKNIFKSIGAIVAGFIVVVTFSTGTDYILAMLGLFPPQDNPDSYTSSLLLVALVYRSLYTVAGGYATAALAPGRPVFHAVILGITGIFAGILGAVVNWEKSSASTAWYPVALVLTALPCTWAGARLFGIRR